MSIKSTRKGRVLSGALAAALMLTVGAPPKGRAAEPMRPMVPEREREWEDIAPPVMTSDAVYDFAQKDADGPFNPDADTIITTPYTAVVTALERKREMLVQLPDVSDAPQPKEPARVERSPAPAPVSELDARLRELYEYYVNRSREPRVERDGIGYDDARSSAETEPRAETARPLPRHAAPPRDTFYSRLETVDMGGLALCVLRGAKNEPRAFGLAVEPESYGLDPQSTFFFPASSAGGLRRMLEDAALRYARTPVGERLGSFFRPDPLGKVGIEVLKSLDGEGKVVLSLFARPRAGDPARFHAQMMREAGLPEREIAGNVKIYRSEPVNLHGLFESAGRFLNYAETEVSAGKLQDYAAGIARLFGGGRGR